VSDTVTTERPQPVPEPASAALCEELRAAKRTIRALEREARKAEARYQELARAYQKTVHNLVKATGRCAGLELERDQWRARAEQAPSAAHVADGALRLSRREVATIRRAMARLHHPDTGGDGERMRAWNTLLDTLERAAPEN
jgi:KaiC/GvpD/RAD55 family RecA-like ATPase